MVTLRRNSELSRKAAGRVPSLVAEQTVNPAITRLGRSWAASRASLLVQSVFGAAVEPLSIALAAEKTINSAINNFGRRMFSQPVNRDYRRIGLNICNDEAQAQVGDALRLCSSAS